MSTPEWLAESLRLTVFLLSPIDAKEQSWWKVVTGEPPEQENSQPRIGLFQQSGAFRENLLQLSIQPTRIDWTLTFLGAPSADEYPVLGTFKEVLPAFADAMKLWLNQAPVAGRLAFGPVLWYQVPDRAEGYALIADLTKLKIDFEGASDFSFQINRPRQSQVLPDLTINRLGIWSVARLQRIQLQFTTGKASPAIASKYACRLQLDVNSAAENAKELPPDLSAKVFGELVDLSVEIATLGDCK